MASVAKWLVPAAVALTSATTAWAQPAPSGGHPRIWLDVPTRSGLSAERDVAGSGVARSAERCAAARANPSEYATGGWQGFEFAITLSSCLVSHAASPSGEDLATAIKYWNVLLDDYQTVGDGAGGDTVVRHDAGYAMRTFAPYSALAYDWLHDAPGVTEELRARSRQRFAAWMAWYGSDGYLPHVPGANYQAGYLFAATLIAIAEGGEAGPVGDEHWATVRDAIWGTDMKPALAAGGVLAGGDWPEGWAYGWLSVLEYALASRALAENGLVVPGADPWVNSLGERYRHALTPVTKQLFVAGDTSVTTPHFPPPNGPLLAVVAVASDEGERAIARQLNAELSLKNENPLFDALAAARPGPSKAAPPDAPLGYMATGAGNWYLRGAWEGDTVWSVLQCSHRLVPDHQHNDAGNWVLTRGADDLVVDPSPYGSLSTLSSNAPAVDSDALPEGYSPSQADWGKTTRWVWAKQLASGAAFGRCDYADQFHGKEQASDVATALRDFVLLPFGADATLVLFDRVVTGSPSRSLYLRVRTPATLSLDSSVATASVGGSSLFVRRLWSTSGDPSVREMPRASECSASERATCDGSRLPSGTEYRLQVAGPVAQAVHVVDATASGASAPSSELLQGAGYRGVLVERGGKRVAVIASDAPSGSAGALAYRVAAASGALHVVLDAPVGPSGRSQVTSVREGSDCAMSVSALSGDEGGYDGWPLAVGVSSDCTLVEEPFQTNGDGSAGTGPALDIGDNEPLSGGCGCHVAEGVGWSLAALASLGIVVAFARRSLRKAASPPRAKRS